MSVVVTATTTPGKPLTQSEWLSVERACELADRLEDARRQVSARCRVVYEWSLIILSDFHLRELTNEHSCSQSLSYRRDYNSGEAFGCGWRFERVGENARLQRPRTSPYLTM